MIINDLDLISIFISFLGRLNPSTIVPTYGAGRINTTATFSQKLSFRTDVRNLIAHPVKISPSGRNDKQGRFENKSQNVAVVLIGFFCEVTNTVSLGSLCLHVLVDKICEVHVFLSSAFDPVRSFYCVINLRHFVRSILPLVLLGRARTNLTWLGSLYLGSLSAHSPRIRLGVQFPFLGAATAINL